MVGEAITYDNGDAIFTKLLTVDNGDGTYTVNRTETISGGDLLEHSIILITQQQMRLSPAQRQLMETQRPLMLSWEVVELNKEIQAR